MLAFVESWLWDDPAKPMWRGGFYIHLTPMAVFWVICLLPEKWGHALIYFVFQQNVEQEFTRVVYDIIYS